MFTDLPRSLFAVQAQSIQWSPVNRCRFRSVKLNEQAGRTTLTGRFYYEA